MSKMLMFALVFLLSATWLQAQQSPKTDASHATKAMAGETKVEGCLHSSNGNYTLTEKSGTVYRLEGDTAKLAEHIGHEVEIAGTAPSGMNASKTSTKGESERTLEVKDVKHISKTCKVTSK
jgi:hypothetical protein